MQILLARTQGFCGGVARAIEVVDRALKKFGTPLYVYHDIVHNTAVVKSFKERGIIFVEDLQLIPEGSRVIFSAHGVPPIVIEQARLRRLETIDATCPLVTKVHREAIRFSNADTDVVLIGHRGHQEMIGTAGHVPAGRLHIVETIADVESLNIPPYRPVAFITQTTLSVDDTREIILKLRARFPRLQGPPKDNICYATQNRQDAIKELAGQCDIIIICGSPNSSNSNRLREKGAQMNVESHIIDSAQELNLDILCGKLKVGISSGASVPRHIVDEVIEKINQRYGPLEIVSFDNPEKNVIFAMPAI